MRSELPSENPLPERKYASRPDSIKAVDAEASVIWRLSKPFWAVVLIGAVSLMGFVTFLTRSLDQNSVELSEQVFAAISKDRADRLRDLTLEYAFWDSTVDKLVNDLDLEWAEETFVDYMQEELQVEVVYLLDGGNNLKLHVLNDAISDAGLVTEFEKGLMTLVEAARNGPKDEAPLPQIGIVGNASDMFLACAVLVTDYGDVDISTDHVMVFAQPISEASLTAIGEKYKLPKLRFSPNPPEFWQGGHKLVSADKRDLGYLVWNPTLPGFRLLPLTALGFLIVFAALFLAGRLFIHRASELVHALETAKRVAEQTKELLADQARRDPLTGLGNRRYLDETMAELERRTVPGDGHALLYLDLDGFKDVNDSYGHETGDLVLQHAANALVALVGPQDAVIRLGGDEFAIVFGEANRERIFSTGRTIIEHLSQPMRLQDVVCHFGASIGISFSKNPSELLRQADVALYAAKRRGRSQMAVYSAELLDFKDGSLEPRRGSVNSPAQPAEKSDGTGVEEQPAPAQKAGAGIS